MCLDGLEVHGKEAIGEHKKGRSPKVSVVRYADDFVITGATPRLLIYRVKPAVNAFGLQLHPEKTKETKVEDGFGYNFRLYPSRTNTQNASETQ
jgi:RNA-directed DNA polymerase